MTSDITINGEPGTIVAPTGDQDARFAAVLGSGDLPCAFAFVSFIMQFIFTLKFSSRS